MKQSYSVAGRLRAVVRLLFAELRLAGRRRRAVKDLKRLSRRELADIGIDRHQLRDVVDAMLATRSVSAPGTLAEVASESRDQARPAKAWQETA